MGASDWRQAPSLPHGQGSVGVVRLSNGVFTQTLTVERQVAALMGLRALVGHGGTEAVSSIRSAEDVPAVDAEEVAVAERSVASVAKGGASGSYLLYGSPTLR